MRRDCQTCKDFSSSKSSQAVFLVESAETKNCETSSVITLKNNYNDKSKDKSPIKKKAKRFINLKMKLFWSNIQQSSYYKKKINEYFPITKWLASYNFKRFLITDMMCGLTISVVNIPQGLAYALLANLNPLTGLYVSFFPVLIYALFGTSKHLVISSVAITSILTGESVNRIVDDQKYSLLYFNRTQMTDKMEEDLKHDVAFNLTVLVGIFQILFGLFGLGGLTSFFSDTFISGYTCGSAVHVIASQIKDFFGLKNTSGFRGNFKIPRLIFAMSSQLSSINLATLVCSLGCFFILALLKEVFNPLSKKQFRFEFPSELLIVILMTSMSYFLDLSQNYKIDILENIPTGFPVPKFDPNFSLICKLIEDAFFLAMIATSLNLSLASLFSRRNRYKINPRQELYAIGLTNFICSGFSCFPTTASLSRSSLLESMGGHSQLASVFNSVIVFVVIIWLAPLLKTLPIFCLACISIMALKNLILQINDFSKYWKINRYEALIWMITFLSTVIVEINFGLFIGIAASILAVVLRDFFSPIIDLGKEFNASNVHVNELCSSECNKEFEVKLGNGNLPSNVRIFKIKHSIYFAVSNKLQNNLYKMYGFQPRKKAKKTTSICGVDKVEIDKEKRYPDIILDFSSVNYVDTNGVQTIKQIIDDYKFFDIEVFICKAQQNFINMLVRMNLWQKYEPHIFVTIEDAIKFSSRRNSSKVYFLIQ